MQTNHTRSMFARGVFSMIMILGTSTALSQTTSSGNPASHDADTSVPPSMDQVVLAQLIQINQALARLQMAVEQKQTKVEQADPKSFCYYADHAYSLGAETTGRVCVRDKSGTLGWVNQ